MDITKIMSKGFSFDLRDQDGKNSRFFHKKSGQYFRYIHGGEYIGGITKCEERMLPKPLKELPISVAEMRPTARLFIEDFLVSESPITYSATREIKRDACRIVFSDFTEFCDISKTFGLDIPTDRQIEYILKLGCFGVFPFMLDYSDYDDFLQKAEIEVAEWMVTEISESQKSTRIGLRGIFAPLWTKSLYKKENQCNANPGTERSDIDIEFVMKSGSFEFWPWQAEEWTWCLPSHKYSSKEMGNNAQAASFLVCNL